MVHGSVNVHVLLLTTVCSGSCNLFCWIISELGMPESENFYEVS
jgi:hypothetical protein